MSQAFTAMRSLIDAALDLAGDAASTPRGLPRHARGLILPTAIPAFSIIV